LVTVGLGKFYSNGLDLNWMAANKSQSAANLLEAHKIFARLLNLPVPTIAAINGHAYAAGMMLALSHDFRVMRDDRGFLCLPEVDLHMPFTPGMNAVIRYLNINKPIFY
jgi:enoyl-CoA hydratase/carnithine racemase